MADQHQVDDAGNLIGYTCVDFRDPAKRYPITVPQKVSSNVARPGLR